MTPQTTTRVYSAKSTITIGFDDADPFDDVSIGSDTIVPARATITYAQQPGVAIPQHIEVHVKGPFRDEHGTVSYLTGTAEVWATIPADDRAPQIAELVAEHLPTWWNR